MSDLRPTHERPEYIPPGTENCECCEETGPATAQRIDNRPGLSVIGYRIGSYGDFRESLIAGLSSPTFGQLNKLQTRNSDDFTIGLIDSFACATDVLTFYQERIANESYLRTATEQVSMQEMGKLIGYRLRPGVAAETWLAFALETPPKPPPGLPPEPGAFVTGVPNRVVIKPGLKVQSVPGPDEKPQIFETVEGVEARPEWNAMRPWLDEVVYPTRGATFTYLKGIANNLRGGDALLFVGARYRSNAILSNWDFRILDRVESQPEQGRTLVSWRHGLTGLDVDDSDPQVWALRKRAAVFGHNAPAWNSMSKEFREGYAGAGYQNLGEWPRFTLDGTENPPEGSSGPTTVFARSTFNTFGFGTSASASAAAFGAFAPGGSGGFGSGFNPSPGPGPTPTLPEEGIVCLDMVLADVTLDGFAVLAKGKFNRADDGPLHGTYVELYKLLDVAEFSRAEYALSGKVTQLTLRGRRYSAFVNAIRDTSVFVQSEQLAFAKYPVSGAIDGDKIPVRGSTKELIAADLLPGRRLIVRGVSVKSDSAIVHYATLVSYIADKNGTLLTVTPPVPDALRRETVVVHANVALASHGETVAQLLGAGDASRSFQRFEFKQTPLTWRAAPTELGAASEFTLRVDDIAWTQKPTLFGTENTERAYTLEMDERGRTWVQFGDGVNGARLPSGLNNVRAAYRKGLGVAGNVDAEKLTQLISRPLGVKSVSNPAVAEGGTDPEATNAARRTMPLVTRTLGRAVSIVDYEDFARAFSGIAKAQAVVLNLSGGSTIAITVAGPNNAVLTPANPVWNNLLAALKANGDPHVLVRLISHKASVFRVSLRIKRDFAYESKLVLASVDAALRESFAFDTRALGQPVQQSEVIAIAQAVPGVVAVDIDQLYGGTQPLGQTLPSRQTRLLASRMRAQAGDAVAAEILTLSDAAAVKLEEFT